MAIEHDVLRKYDELHGRTPPDNIDDYDDDDDMEEMERRRRERRKRKDRAGPPPPPPPCLAERHGGQGGAAHELTCKVRKEAVPSEICARLARARCGNGFGVRPRAPPTARVEKQPQSS